MNFKIVSVSLEMGLQSLFLLVSGFVALCNLINAKSDLNCASCEGLVERIL